MAGGEFQNLRVDARRLIAHQLRIAQRQHLQGTAIPVVQ